MFKLVCLVVLANVISAQHHHGTSVCKFIQSADCSIFATHKTCATDAKTYNNECEFAKSHCDTPHLHHAHNGTCDPLVDKPDPTLSGTDIAYKFFCANLKHQHCGADFEIVCGSNMVTYDNLCLYEQARCSFPGLVVSTYQACPV